MRWYLGKNRCQADLPEKSGLAAHVGTSEEDEAGMSGPADAHIVGDEGSCTRGITAKNRMPQASG